MARCPRARRELHRHRRRVHPGRVGDDGRASCSRASAHDWVLATKLGNKMSERPNEGALLAQLDAARGRRQPAAPADRPRRHPLPAPRLQRHGPGGAAARARRAAARRQDPLLGRVQLPRLAHRRGRARLPAQMGMPGPVVCQPYYNLLNRMPEVEVLPACEHYGIGVTPYSPIARGVLTGKYAPGQPPAAGHARRPRRQAHRRDRVPRGVAARSRSSSRRMREAAGIALAHFATAWVLAHRAVSSRDRRAAHAGSSGRTTCPRSTTPSTPRTRRWSTRW